MQRKRGIERLEARQMLAAQVLGSPMAAEDLANGSAILRGGQIAAASVGDMRATFEAVGAMPDEVALDLPAGLPAQFAVSVPFAGQVFELKLEKHTAFGANTRFLVDDGSGQLAEVDAGVDRSYLGTVVGRPDYVVSAVLTEAGLMANIIRPNQASIVIEPALGAADRHTHRVFVDERTAGDVHSETEHDHPHHGTAELAALTTEQAGSDADEGTYAPPQAVGSGSTATLPPSRVIQVREFEVGVEIGSAALLNNYAGSTTEQKVASAMAEAQKIPGNMDARYLHGAGIKHRLGTVIIRTGSDTFTVQNGNDNAGLSAFRNYWNNNPQEVGTTHDLAVYHVRASPSGLAYVDSVGTSSRYALTASNGPSSWADGTLVHEFGHSWSLGHVPSEPSSSYYESKPRNTSGSNSAGGEDVFVSVMHGGGSHNIGRLSSGEANQVYNKSLQKASFGDPVAVGPVKPFGRRDSGTTMGETITIDVIANDYDANNDVLDVQLLDTVSQQGGTISLSMGTGPGGRNEIVYTPPVGGFVGSDFFHYTVVDSTGRSDWGAVYVAVESASVVDLNKTSYNYDFGTTTSPVLTSTTTEWRAITPTTFGDIYWTVPVSATDRGASPIANDANRDFVTSAAPATLEHKIANGVWSVTLNMGDSAAAHDNMSVSVEGNRISGDIDSPGGQFSYVTSSGGSSTPGSFQVTVYDGSLSITFEDLGGTDPSWVVNRMSLNLIDATPVLLDVFIDPATGQAVVENNTAGDVSFDGYVFQDTTASLLPGSWMSLEDQKHDAGIWFEAGDSVANPTFLAELTNSGETTLAPGESLYLGAIVDPALAAELTFQYYRSNTDTLRTGVITFEDPGVQPLPGDYNLDGAVNLADYAVWRDWLGGSTGNFGGADGNGDGTIDQVDYQVWKRNFGASLPQQVAALSANLASEAEATSTSAASSPQESLSQAEFMAVAPIIFGPSNSPAINLPPTAPQAAATPTCRDLALSLLELEGFASKRPRTPSHNTEIERPTHPTTCIDPLDWAIASLDGELVM